MSITHLRDSFIEQINNAKDLDELERIYKNITDTINDIIKNKTGYKSGSEVPTEKWNSYSKIRSEIYNELKKDDVGLYEYKYIKSKELGKQSHTSVHDAELRSNKNERKGGKCKSRRTVKNKKFRKPRRKSTQKSS